ncbi:helix-turn-helix transcriptional regulator [Leuconostoc mesenteroides]|uniref:helix-turn-helix domain-containing protein n=1 Tax=Leuconostoc mesenteroides TaxID=1245 RepID=UPI001B8BEAA8|nr:helix-turn-helix transcriptional regulator [Leuconostoc mesenteroides]MBS0941284.1 helix-turn-helix transcriptional regulator [Leuconostoc mesenteroides]
MALTLAEKIKFMLDNNGKTIYWLAKETGLAFGALYPIVSGKRKYPSFETMEKIADVLDISLDEFRTNKK